MESSRFAHMVSALNHRNFRLFLIGQCISWIGTWMQQVAVGWLAYKLSNSAWVLGMVNFAGQIPTLFITPLAGVLADRFDRHKVVIITQTLSMVQALILAWLTLTHQIQLWHLVLLGLFMGVINAVDMPTRQAFMVQMVDKKDDLPNAIALNSSLVNVARLVGPTVAGILIATVGEGICFLLNGLSYIAVIVALLAMHIQPNRYQRKDETGVFQHLKEGYQYAFGFAPIRVIVILLAAVCLMGQPYFVLMPVFAKDVFHGNSDSLGLLMGASGVGALVAAVYLAARKSVLGLGNWLFAATLIFGSGLVAFSLVQSFWTAAFILVFIGFGMMMQMAGTNTLLHTLTEEDKRGRVMSLYTMAFMGVTPFGSLLGGYLAARLGAQHTVLLCGLCSIACALAFGAQLPKLRTAAHPVYVQKGIIAPEGAD